MKKSLILFTGIAALFLLGGFNVRAAHDSKEVTVTGEGKCAKCSLKEAEKCQNVIQVEEHGKTVNYYLVKNEVADNFHENLCKTTKKVTATGTVKEVGGKKELTATKIELAGN
jgi:RecG-like helicase